MKKHIWNGRIDDDAPPKNLYTLSLLSASQKTYGATDQNRNYVKANVYTLNLHANGKMKRQNAWWSAKTIDGREEEREESENAFSSGGVVVDWMPYIFILYVVDMHESIHIQKQIYKCFYDVAPFWRAHTHTLWLIAFPSLLQCVRQKSYHNRFNNFWKINWSCFE